MNKIFEPKRFVSYLGYDLRSAWNNYGVSFLIIAMLPLLVFVFNTIVGLVFEGVVDTRDNSYSGMLFALAVFILIVSFSARTYGQITDKKYGSSWVLLPASVFEKFLSMLIITCVVVPVGLVVVFGATDLLLSKAFPASYGPGLLNNMDLNLALKDSIGVSVNFPALIYVSYAVSMLAFTLGAVIFKKAKPAKTFLVLMGISFLLSSLAMLLVSGGILDSDRIESIMEAMTEERLQSLVNTWLNVPNLICTILLMCGLYFRLKTIKH
ncbi:MAG: hypothetical protein IJU63_04780 [Bacteroidales bacterium]|nr:hypothetical protein [Bacteroidales bacterium]